MKRFGFFGAKSKPSTEAVEHVRPDMDAMSTKLTAGANGTEIVFAVQNHGKTAQTFCVFQTPLEDFRADILEVTGPDGARMDYVGVKIKRNPPKERHFVTLAPGETREATFALESGYALIGDGPFEVQFIGTPAINGLPDSNRVVVAPR